MIFDGIEYGVREITLPEFGNVLISTEQLNFKLFDENSNYVTHEANVIDDQIFYFVESNEITLMENELIELLISQIK